MPSTKDIYLVPSIVVLVYMLPVILRYMDYGNLQGGEKDSRYIFGSFTGIAHGIQGVIAGLLLSPMYIISDQKWFEILRTVLLILLSFGYSFYNLSKRLFKKKNRDIAFADTSFLLIRQICL